ncbi:unnamed protein product [Aureobasidium pullulans]|nr:unnamed protein product [Aureobasidium pullulans]
MSAPPPPPPGWDAPPPPPPGAAPPGALAPPPPGYKPQADPHIAKFADKKQNGCACRDSALEKRDVEALSRHRRLICRPSTCERL